MGAEPVKDPSYAIQAAVYTALAASTGVKALLGDPVRVFDKVEANPTYPYARIGDDQVVGDSNSCHDGWEVYVTVHVFGRDATAPRPQVKQIGNAIALAIGDNNALIAPAGFLVTEVELEQSRTYMEEDGLTAHAVLVFKFLVDDGA